MIWMDPEPSEFVAGADSLIVVSECGPEHSSGQSVPSTVETSLSLSSSSLLLHETPRPDDNLFQGNLTCPISLRSSAALYFAIMGSFEPVYGQTD